MPIYRHSAFVFLLLTPYIGASGPGGVVPPHSPGDSGIVLTDSNSLRYASDIYLQSGGIRVREENLSPDGLVTYNRFLTRERLEQRGFLWRALKLGNVNFVHHGPNKPLVSRTQEKTIEGYSDVVLDGVATTLEFADKDAMKSSFFNIKKKPPMIIGHRIKYMSFEHYRNVAWNVDTLNSLIDTLIVRPLYNDMPGVDIGQFSGSKSTHTFKFPRFQDSDAVVNYRANMRTLATERLNVLNEFEYRKMKGSEVSRFEKGFKTVLEKIEQKIFFAQIEPFLVNQLTTLSDDSVNINVDINVDALIGSGAENEHQVICEGIAEQIQDAYRTRDAVAQEVLQKIAIKETTTANKYAKFNRDISPDIATLQFKSGARMHENIENVYQRALLRRKEFHKMTEPVVVSSEHGITYRVHFTDPEHRYVSTSTIARKKKIYYKKLWENLAEPIFKETIVDNIRDNPLQNIVLVDSDTSKQDQSAYVEGGNMVIMCDEIRDDPVDVRHTIIHEYGHVVDESMHERMSEGFESLENHDDFRTLSRQTIKEKLTVFNSEEREIMTETNPSPDEKSRLDTIRSDKQRLENVLEAMKPNKRFGIYVHNDDTSFGRVSNYALENSDEAVAEQLYAMRNKAIRTALLRRMTQHETVPDAAMQKSMYDIVRNEFKDVAPSLYAQFGENYEGRLVQEWGLLPGRTKQVDLHYQILALDNSLATVQASDNLAEKFLQEGYDVVILKYGSQEKRPECLLQSNLKDLPSGENTLKSTLLIVGGNNIDGATVADRVVDSFIKFTPTGRDNSKTKINPRFEKVEFARSPSSHAGLPRIPDEQFRTDFVNRLMTHYSDDPHLSQSSFPQDISLLDGVTHGIWTEDSNKYKQTMFDFAISDEIECLTIP